MSASGLGNSKGHIAALTSAAEFLLCAVRAAAMGAALTGPNVKDPIAWAKQKILEAETLAEDTSELT